MKCSTYVKGWCPCSDPKTAIRSLRFSNFLLKKGQIEERMMYNTFNMGLGMVVAVDEADVDKTMASIKGSGRPAICSRNH